VNRIGTPKTTSPLWRPALCILALAGFSINLLLLARRLGDDSATLAGCGPGSGCEAVLGSQWSQIFGIPVTLPGLLIYAAVMLGLTRAGRGLLAPLLGLILAAIVWFVFVQAVLIRAFCPWCMAAHVVGIALIALGLPYAAHTSGSWFPTLRPFLAAAAGGGILLASLQWFGPKPATHRITEFDAAPPTPRVTPDAHAQGEGRLALFFDGSKGYRVSELPHIGRADAQHVLIEYFDYGCGACRTMSSYLDALVAAHPEEICVVLLPMPLDRDCNPLLPPLEPGHPGACEMARASLAIWRHARENFHAFHTALLADPTAENASMLASALLGDPAAAMRDPWVDSIIQTNISDWQVISADNPKLPKLIVGERRIMQGFPATEAEFIQVIADQLGLPQ
jgi:uncharacterized membrane protein